MMFQGPKGFIAQICEVHLQYGNSTKNGRFTLFFSKFPIIYDSIRFGHNAEIEGWEIIDDLDILFHEV